MLRACLDHFYSRAPGHEEGAEVFSRSKEQHRLLLLHLLMAALFGEDYEMGGRCFEALRAALQDMVTCYRCDMSCQCSIRVVIGF